MDCVWRCILAGGSRHCTWVIQNVPAELSFPPAIELDGDCYLPMTLTSSNSSVVPMAGSCVMTHSQATLEQVQEAHQMMLAIAMVASIDEAADASARDSSSCAKA